MSSLNLFKTRTGLILRYEDDNDITPIAGEPQQLEELWAQGQKADYQMKSLSPPGLLKRVSKKFRFVMLLSVFNITTRRGVSDWDRWYQIVCGFFQITGVHPILTKRMTEYEDNGEYDDQNSAISWIK